MAKKSKANKEVRGWRESRGLTQAEAADIIKVAHRTWQDWEYGISAYPEYARTSAARWDTIRSYEAALQK